MRPDRRKRPTLDVIDGGLVDRNHARARAGFDGHIADRHATFHRQRPNCRTGKFNRVAGAAGRADLADHGQHDIFGGDARANGAVKLHQHGFGFFCQQRLRGQHVLDFRGADAMCQTSKRAVRGRVRVAADNGHAWQGRALLWADHVHDALTLIVHVEIGQAVFFGVCIQRLDLQPGDRVSDAIGTVGGGDVVIGDDQVGRIAPGLAAGQLQTFKGLRAGDFVYQVPVNIKNGGAVFCGVHHMRLPEFVVERLGHGGKDAVCRVV